MMKEGDFKATLIDENGNELIYEPLAYMSYDGQHFVIMHAKGDSGMEDDLLVLRAEGNGEKQVYSVVEDDDMVNKAIFEGLGIGKNLLN